jgi:hypothetical protein
MSKIDSAEVAALHKRHSLRYADLQLSRSLSIMTTFFIALNLPNYIYRITLLLRPTIQVCFAFFDPAINVLKCFM